MKRRWRVPPPPFGGLDAALGAAVLEENAGSVGVLLWDAARDVVLWSTSSRDELADLFAPAAERMRMTSVITTMLDRRLENGLQVLARMVGRPALANRERASMACREVSQWADNQGALATAYAFAHAAALCCPGSANLSYEAGRVARRRAEYGTAHSWLGRAALLGRQTGDWESYARSFSGLGNTYLQRGDNPKARKYHLRCRTVARKHGLSGLHGDACHDLCILAYQAGSLTELTQFAKEALEAFGPNSPRVPTLAHDVAYAWMEQSYFTQALNVFEATRPHFRYDQRIIVVANICRAAAGIANLGKFDAAWKDAMEEMGVGSKEYKAEALLELARGAALMGRWEDAIEAGNQALAIASSRKEHRLVFTAESVLEAIATEQAAAESVVFEPMVETAPDDVVEFADELVGSLGAYATVGV